MVAKIDKDDKRKKEYADRLLEIVNEELDSLPPKDAAETIKRIKSSLTTAKQTISTESEADKLKLKENHDVRTKYLKRQLERVTEELKEEDERFNRDVAEKDTRTKKKTEKTEAMLETLGTLFGGRCDGLVDKENESPKKKQRKA